MIFFEKTQYLLHFVYPKVDTCLALVSIPTFMRNLVSLFEHTSLVLVLDPRTVFQTCMRQVYAKY
jgi:hypothetical protein